MPPKPSTPKPRNPYVAAAKFRRAGAHDKTEKARRRRDAVALIQTIKGSRRNGGEGAFQTSVPQDAYPESAFVAPSSSARSSPDSLSTRPSLRF